MKKILFVICYASIAAMACNSQSSNSQAVDTSVTKTDTLPASDTSAKTTPVNPSELSSAEIPDDTVFTDGSKPSSWQNAGFTNPAGFKNFLQRLQSWVADNNKDSVASVVAYPLHNPKAKDKAAFIAKYDDYITDNVKKALKEQNLKQIFRNSQGAMIGDGKLWFSETKDGYRIIAINK